MKVAPMTPRPVHDPALLPAATVDRQSKEAATETAAVPPVAAAPDASTEAFDQATKRHLADLKIYGPVSAMQAYQIDQANPPPDLPDLGWLLLAPRLYGPLPRR